MWSTAMTPCMEARNVDRMRKRSEGGSEACVAPRIRWKKRCTYRPVQCISSEIIAEVSRFRPARP